MPGGGLVQLAASQNTGENCEDYFLVGNPEITFFKTLHKHHTNFAKELMEYKIDNVGLNQKITFIIPRDGDLLYKIYLKIKGTKYFNSKKKFVYIDFNENNFINYLNFLNDSYNYVILQNEIPKQNLLIYKNISNNINTNLIYSNIKLINNEIFIQEIHIDNIINDNFIYINYEKLKYNFENWSFKLYLNDEILETNGDNFNDILNSNLYNFKNKLLSNSYKLIINEIIITNNSLNEFKISKSYKYSFKIDNDINHNIYTLYPNYIYKFIYNEINNLCISDIPFNLVDLKYKLSIPEIDFSNILPINYKQIINLTDIKIYNYATTTKVIITLDNNYNFSNNNYIKIIDNNSNNNTPFNNIFKINDINENNNSISIFIDNSFSSYNINNINNIYIEYFPYISFIENEYNLYFIFNKKYNISLVEIITYIQESSKIDNFNIYGSNEDSTITQKNIDNNNSDNWSFIQKINDSNSIINEKLYYNIDFNYYKYFKFELFYSDNSTLFNFKHINFYENLNIDISDNLLSFQNETFSDIENINNSKYTLFNLQVNNININNIVLDPDILSDSIINNITTTTNNNGFGLILKISINNNKISNISIINSGYNYIYDDIIYVNKSYFNSNNDLIIKLKSNNFITIEEYIYKYDYSMNNILWKPLYNIDYNINKKNKSFDIILNEKILPCKISFIGAENENQYISLFNFYGLNWKTNNYNSKIINYSLDLDELNSLITIENFKSIEHNSHLENNFCNSDIIDKNHFSIQHSNFIYFNINKININSDNLFIYDYNISYIKNVNLNDEYNLVNNIIDKFNYKLKNNNILNYEFKIDSTNKLIFKKTDFDLIIVNNFLYKLGFSNNNIYYQNNLESGFYNSNFYLSDFEIPFETIEITNNDNSFKLNNDIILLNNGTYSRNELINELENQISNSEYEILYFYNKFCFKKKNFVILDSSFNSYIKFNNNIKNLNFIINISNNSISYNVSSVVNQYFIKSNYYNIDDLLLEISNFIHPINIKLLSDNRVEIYDTDFFELIKIENNILDSLGFYINSAIFSYINNRLIIIDNGFNYKLNDIIKIIDPNNSNNIILAKTILVTGLSLNNFEIISIEGDWSNIDENLLLYDFNKYNYNVKYINNSYTIRSEVLCFITINSKNNKVYIQNNNNLQILPTIIDIPNNIYTPFQIKNIIQNLLFQLSYDIIINIENNKFVFKNYSNQSFSILYDNEYSNNILPILGFHSTINLINNNTNIYSNIFINYVNNNTYYSDTNINSILDSDIKSNIQNYLGNNFDIKYEDNKYSISKSNFNIHYNNYKGFFEKFSFDMSENIDYYYLSNNGLYDCSYMSFKNISIQEPIYFNNNNNIILIDNYIKFDNILYNSEICIKLEYYYENFNLLKSYINSKLDYFDINFEYIDNSSNSSESKIILKKKNFQILSQNDVLPTLGFEKTFPNDTTIDELVCIPLNEPIRNSKIFILKNGELDSSSSSVILKDEILINNNIECKVLKWEYTLNNINRLELEVISNNTNFDFSQNFINNNNNFIIKFSLINTQNAIVINDFNNKFYYSHLTEIYDTNFISPSAFTVTNSNYNIQELLIELQKIDSNLKISLIEQSKFQFKYEFSGISQPFKLLLQNDLFRNNNLFTNIFFDISINSHNNTFTSIVFNDSYINITSNNSIVRFNENNIDYSINFYELYLNNNIDYKTSYTPSEFSILLTQELNNICKSTYQVLFNNLSQFIIKKSNFKIYLYKNNLLNIIPFTNRYNNNSFKSDLLSSNIYNINEKNNSLIYYDNNIKYLNIPYNFENDFIDEIIQDNNFNRTAYFKLSVLNNLVSSCIIYNSGSNYSINDLIIINYNETNNNIISLYFNVLNVGNLGEITEISNIEDFKYYKIYTISNLINTFTKLLNYNYSFNYLNNKFIIQKSNFIMINNNNSILNTLNFNEITYINNNKYSSSNYNSNIVNVKANNNTLIIQDFDNKEIIGNVTINNNTNEIFGNLTNFQNDLKKNDFISINNNIYQIDKIHDTQQILYLKNIIITDEIGPFYYYLMKTYTFVCDINEYTIINFITYFNNLINQYFIDNSYITNNQKFIFLYENNQFIIQKTKFSIINNNNISPNLAFTQNQTSINNNSQFYILSNNIPDIINITNENNKLSITLFPIHNYSLYFTNNSYNVNQFQDLTILIQNKLNDKSIFYEITYDVTSQKFIISNYKYKFKLIKSSFLESLGFNIDQHTTFNYSNQFISNNPVTNIINIVNENNFLNIEEIKTYNHNIFFSSTYLTTNNSENLQKFLNTFKNKLKIIDNGFDIEIDNNRFKITNNIKFRINVLSNFTNIFNYNTNINNIISFSFNYNNIQQITISKYTNQFLYTDTLFSYTSINNGSLELNDIIYNISQDTNLTDNYYIYTDKNNHYLNIQKTYFNFVFNNSARALELLGFVSQYNNQLTYTSKSLPLKNTLISQNYSLNLINTTSGNNNFPSLTNNFNLSSYQFDIINNKNILLRSIDNSNIEYYVSILQINNLTITINETIPNIQYNIYNINNLLTFEDWTNNNIPIIKDFEILNNSQQYAYYRFEIISFDSNTDTISYNSSISNFKIEKYQQINIELDNIKYYTGINNIFQQQYYLTTNSSSSHTIDIKLTQSIIPYKLYLESININRIELVGYNNNYNDLGVILIDSTLFNNKNYIIDHQNNYYKYYKFIFYYNLSPQINIFKLYKYQLTNNIQYNSNFIKIDTSLIDNNQYYITTKNIETFSLAIKKTKNKFHYVFTNNLNNLFISSQSNNPSLFINDNDLYTNTTILDDYNNYDKLYYYIQTNDINDIYIIPKNQIIYINQQSIILQSDSYNILDLLFYLNETFLSFDIKFSYNYITKQVNIYHIQDTIFELYNKFTINDDINSNLIIYNNICYITFKTIHNLETNQKIYIYSPNISFLNNIFTITYIDKYNIQFNIIQNNQYIIDNNIRIYKYSDSFFDIFNIIPTINNILLTTYTSQIINNITYNGIINCIDISLSDISNIIKNVSIHIGNTKIDSQSYKWNDLYNELLNNNQYYLNNAIKSNNLNQSNTYYIPLKFWFNNNYELALPLISLQYHSIFLEIETNSHFGFKTNIELDTIDEFNVLLDYIFLDDSERKVFASREVEYLITYINKIENLPVNNNYNNIQLNSFENPVKTIFFYLNNCKLENASIQFNEKLRTQNHNEKYYRIIQKYENNIKNHLKLDHTLNDIRQWNKINDLTNPKTYDSYLYSFCLNLQDNINPSGSINFSQFKDSYLILNLKEVQEDSSVDIYAITYNILVITNGMGGLKYTKG